MENKKVLMLASVASMIDQFNMPNIRLLQEMGYKVHVMCNFITGNTCDRHRIVSLKRRFKEMGVIFFQWDCPRNIFSGHRSGKDPSGRCLRAYRQLVHRMEKTDYAWIHCHSPVGGALARIVAHRKKVRIVYTAHGFHFYRGAPWISWILYYPAEKLLSCWTDLLITVNREDYRLAKQRLKAAKVCCIPGVGIDTGRFEAGNKNDIRRTYGIPADAILMLSVGELSRRKNHQAAIRALAQTGRRDVHYLICGQGSCRRALEALINRLQLAGQVHLAGFQEDPVKFYQCADIFVFPSLQEGMPVALMEAMAAGLPCIVSDIRGNRELIGSGQGIRFAPAGQRQLLAGLNRLLGHPQLRLAYGRAGRQKVKSYDLVVVEDFMRKIYGYCDRSFVRMETKR